MPFMNSLWPATFWVAGQQTFFASSFSHAEKTTAKSADGHVAPAIGLLWLLITLLTLLRKLHSKHRQTPGQMFSEHPWYVAVYTNMSSKWQVGLVIFPLGVLITNRTNSDPFPPSVHHPLFLPHVPYEFLMASHILGGWPATILCEFLSHVEKTTAKSADGHAAPTIGLCGSL